jgi:hypothetical protein
MNCCCALLVGVSLTIGQTPVNENLKVVEPLIGEWVGTFPVPEDMIGTPDSSGLSVGETVPATVRYSWGANGRSVDIYFGLMIGGVETPITKGLMTWCPKSKAVVGFDSYANGTTVRYKITRKDNRFHWDIEGVEDDGDEMSYKLDATVTADKFVTRSSDYVSAGKRLPDGKEVVLHRADMTSTTEAFDEFCKAWKGLWVSSTTMETDTPGIGKEGDKVTEYADCDIVDNGNTMACRGYTGDGSNTWIVAYDANKRQLKTMWSTSDGLFARGTMYKEGEQWVNKAEGCKPDGTKISYHHVVTISDNGNTHTWDGKVAIGDESVVETHQVYHRVGK